ncbi:polyphenol oxidase family protein [candidate division WWE3 bacterium]|uniref:Polyphenol oxidase family protein n=1 Tax=candidate division WWE3 bacterium TaxID=2053526 RepID=A0A955LKR7_UNCKA|nr:polyphenol oxidase family protein [candidate division WWE3 bacterium]
MQSYAEIKYLKPNVGHFPTLTSSVINGFSWGKDAGNMSFTFGSVSEVLKRQQTFFNDLSLGRVRDCVTLIPEHQDRIVDLTSELKDSLKVTAVGAGIKADAIFTHLKDQTLVVKPADCTTALIYAIDSEGREVIGIVHSGWRGVDAELPKKSIQHLIDVYRVRPEDIRLSILPHIFKEHRTQETIDTYKNLEKYGQFMEKKGELWHFDECGCALSQYQDTGVLDENIEIYNIDTYAEAEKGNTFSQKLEVNQKRQGIEPNIGRFIAVIMMTKNQSLKASSK